jgi:hypothetical protein
MQRVCSMAFRGDTPQLPAASPPTSQKATSAYLAAPPPPPWAHQLVHPTRALWNVRALRALSNGCCFTHGELLIPMQASELFARARTWRMQLWEPFWIERAM